jgi:hypothetical protein
MRERFSADWDALATFIIDNANTTEKRLANTRVWLNKMKLNAPKWAACYTWRHKTYGVHSTQRAEAIHSVVAMFCSKHSSIVDLVMDIERMSSIQQNTAETNALRAQFNKKMGPGTHISPLANALAEKLEEYAAHITRCQASQISLYSHEETTDVDSKGDKVYITSIHPDVYGDGTDVNSKETQRAIDHGVLEPCAAPMHRTSVNSCSCQFEECFGLLCRHRFYVMIISSYKPTEGVSERSC